MLKIRPSLIVTAIVVANTLCQCAAVAQGDKRDPKVQALFDLVTASYKALPNLILKVTFKLEVSQPNLFPNAKPETLNLKYSKPGKISATYVEKQKNGKLITYKIVGNGDGVWIWRSDENAWYKSNTPVVMPIGISSIGAEFDVLFRNKDPFKELPIPGGLLTIVAPSKIGDVDVDVVEGKVSATGVPVKGTYRMMFGQKDHLVRSVVFEGKGINGDGKDLSFKIEAIYDKVDTEKVPAAEEFSGKPPADAKEVSAPPTKKTDKIL